MFVFDQNKYFYDFESTQLSIQQHLNNWSYRFLSSKIFIQFNFFEYNERVENGDEESEWAKFNRIQNVQKSLWKHSNGFIFFHFFAFALDREEKKNWTSIKIFAYLAENVFAIPLLCLAETKASANRNYYILFLFVR